MDDAVDAYQATTSAAWVAAPVDNRLGRS